MSNIVRSPAIIAEEINGIKSQTSAILGAAFTVARQSCFEIGKRLEEAKSLLPHGEWGKWLEENVSYSESTANDLMRIYREFGGEQLDMLTGKCPRDVFEGLSQSQMVALFALPPAERIPFVEEHREALEGGEMSVRELKRQIEAYKDQLEAAEIHRDDAKRLADSEYEKRKTAEKMLDNARAELEELKSAPVEAQVVVHSPSEEQMAQIRAEIEEEVREGYDERLAAAEDDAKQKWKSENDTLTEELMALREELQAARREAETASKKAEKARKKEGADLEAAKAEAAEANRRSEEIKAEYERKLRAANNQSGAQAEKVKLYLSEAMRYITAIDGELTAMDGDEPGSGRKLRASVAAKLDRVLSERGLAI